LLWGIATDRVLGYKWVFKGGTCLKKCYIETYRFSEDLDFTVLPGGPFAPDAIEPLLLRVLDRVADASGIDFRSTPPNLRLRPDGKSTEGRVYYIGPRQTPQAARGRGRLIWPQCGRLIWPHFRPSVTGGSVLFGARIGGRRRDGFKSGAVRADPQRS